MSLLNGTALNHGSLSIAPSFSGTESTSNHARSRQAPSTYDSVLCAGLQTKLLIAGSSALTWAAGIRRVKGVKKIGLLDAPDAETMKGSGISRFWPF